MFRWQQFLKRDIRPHRQFQDIFRSLGLGCGQWLRGRQHPAIVIRDRLAGPIGLLVERRLVDLADEADGFTFHARQFFIQLLFDAQSESGHDMGLADAGRTDQIRTERWP